MKTMLAARYLGPDRIEAEQIRLPQIGPGESLIQVEACGFCGSDLNIVAGTHPRAQAPLTIGHELSGRIVQIADSKSNLATGDRVTTYPLISCGTCYACTHGNPHVCRQLRHLDVLTEPQIKRRSLIRVSAGRQLCQPKL